MATAFDTDFSSNRVSLLDRGFVYAIAHVRGGAELGQAWYEAGRLMNKRNTFGDFVAATDFLVGERWGAADKVFASGSSAGGLLMGVIANEAGDRYKGIALQVPFVDVLTTMLDDTIPLTANEWTQWGDPRQKAAYDYILSYSPYDNIASRDYPAMLVSTGLWDSQVQYYEPAKYVARLRANKTDSNPLLLHVNMQAGHGGAVRALRETDGCGARVRVLHRPGGWALSQPVLLRLAAWLSERAAPAPRRARAPARTAPDAPSRRRARRPAPCLR